MDGFTLWLKDGDIVIDEDGKPILCDTCPCGMEIELICPESLHTLGEAKPYYVTVTYSTPSANNHLPVVEISYNPPELYPDMRVVQVDDPRNNLEWSGEPGDGTRTLGPVYIQAEGSISEIMGREGIAYLTAWDPADIYEDGVPRHEESCWITVYDRVECSLTVDPSPACRNAPVDARIALTGQGAASLVKVTSGSPDFPGGRFEVVLNDIDLIFGITWSDGVWEGVGLLPDPTKDTVSLRLEEFGAILCSHDLEIENCLDEDIQIDCPTSLHIYGAAKRLLVTITRSAESTGWVMPDMAVLVDGEGADVLIDDATNLPVDFSVGWETSVNDLVRTWDGMVRVDTLPASFTGGEGDIIVAAMLDRGDAPPLTLAKCVIHASDLVDCSIDSYPADPCPDSEFKITMTMVAKGTGEALPRLDDTPFGDRFMVGVDNALYLGDCSPHTGWLEGHWECEDVSVNYPGPVLVVIEDRGEEICEREIQASMAGTDLTCSDNPGMLHIYGEAKRLRIDLKDECDAPDMDDWDITATIMVDGTDRSLSLYLALEDGPLSFAPSMWADGVWDHKVLLLPTAQFNDGETWCGIRLTVSAERIGSQDDPVSAMIEFRGDRELAADVSFSKSSAMVYELFDLTVTITSGSGAPLPRLPSDGGVIMTHGPVDPSSAAAMAPEPSFVFTKGVCELSDLSVDIIGLYYARAEQVLGSVTKSIGYDTIYIREPKPIYPDLDDLIDAINERAGCAGVSPVPAETTSLSTVYAGIQAIALAYTGSSPAQEGVLTFPADQGYQGTEAPGPPPSEPYGQAEYGAWVSAAYQFVRSLVYRYSDVSARNVMGVIGMADNVFAELSNITGCCDGWQGTYPCPKESAASMWERAYRAARSNTWAIGSPTTIYAGADKASESTYAAWMVKRLHIAFGNCEFVCDTDCPGLARTVSIYMASAEYTNYYFGFPAIPAGQTRLFISKTVEGDAVIQSGIPNRLPGDIGSRYTPPLCSLQTWEEELYYGLSFARGVEKIRFRHR